MAKLTKMLGKYGATALLHIFFVAALYGTQDVSARVVIIRDRNPIPDRHLIVDQIYQQDAGGQLRITQGNRY